MKLSLAITGLLAAALSVEGQDIDTRAIRLPPTTADCTLDVVQTCYPMNQWDLTGVVGEMCLTIEGSVMTVKYTLDNPNAPEDRIFKAEVFVGGDIDDAPASPTRNEMFGTAFDYEAFTPYASDYVGGDAGVLEYETSFDVSDQVSTECAAGSRTLTVVPAALIATPCHPTDPSVDPGFPWVMFSNVASTSGQHDVHHPEGFPYPSYSYMTIDIPDAVCTCEDPNLGPPRTGSSSGDPHFKTWYGEKFDYHGECDLVLVDNPAFDNGKGLKVHIRTTRVKYFSYIERIAVQIGDDVLEFENDTENFLVNGAPAEPNRRYHKTRIGGYIVRRDKKALSIRLQEDYHAKGGARIDLHRRKNGFPAVIISAGETDVFKGSGGLLGNWESTVKLGRDGQTEIADANEYALEWQVRDHEPMLFKESRFPQFPQTCTPPAKILGTRLGLKLAQEEAEKACAHWKEDKEDCIFDVIATRDVMVAEEGQISVVA